MVNLTAFETFFPEQRPFFVEGADIFQFGGLNTFNNYGFTQFFYSRRIGRQPQGVVRDPAAVEAHAPEATTILGAAKVSGIGRWSVADEPRSPTADGRFAPAGRETAATGGARSPLLRGRCGATSPGRPLTAGAYACGRPGGERAPYLRSRASCRVDGPLV